MDTGNPINILAEKSQCVARKSGKRRSYKIKSFDHCKSTAEFACLKENYPSNVTAK